MVAQAPEREVTVCIVTHDDADDLATCFQAVGALDHRPLRLVLVDCASRDGSLDAARALAPRLRSSGVAADIVDARANLGFAGGMNLAFALGDAAYILTLNADARPEADYVTRLLRRATETPRTGAVTGRLVRPPDASGTVRLDACGMRLTRTWRHLDRGSGEVDQGQYPTAARVFGATGAATLFVRDALTDVAFADGAVFDPDFHSFREDAELAFRLAERGWHVLYEPAAVAEHRRSSLPERRRAMPAAVNRHSLKNRYLLRAYHQTPGNALRTLVPTLARDLGALLYVLAAERSSFSAYTWLWRNRARILAKRREIQRRKTVPAADLDGWFRHDARPL